MDFQNRYRGVKWKRLLLWLSGFALCGVGAVVGYRGYMNYQGYCWEESRYLTGQEKIHRAIELVLRKYPPYVLPTVKHKENGRLVEKIIPIEDFIKSKEITHWSQMAPETPIFYNSIDDFLQTNPDCCELREDQNFHNTSEFGGPSFLDKATGTTSSYIRIRYWVRYMEDGKEQRVQVSYYGDLSNCGKINRSHIISKWAQDRNANMAN